MIKNFPHKYFIINLYKVSKICKAFGNSSSAKFSKTNLKSQDKNVNISRTKIAFNLKEKTFLSFLKDFQLTKVVSDWRVDL